MNHHWPVKEIIATYSLTLFPLPLTQKSTSAGVQSLPRTENGKESSSTNLPICLLLFWQEIFK